MDAIANIPVRLDLGAGDNAIEGFTPIDRRMGTEVYPLDRYADNSVEEIRASHILEHFPFAEVAKVLTEWVRVLKPGGRIRIAVPDFDKVAMVDSDIRLRYMMGGQTDANDFHKSAFDFAALKQFMVNAGIAHIEAWTSDNTDCASLPISLNLEGVKATRVDDLHRQWESLTSKSRECWDDLGISVAAPKPAAKPKATDIKIAALMSVPRVGWNDSWAAISDALRPFKIPIRTFNGVFWGHCMQNLLEDCVSEGLDWALTIDYDSMFSAEHLDRLIGWFGQSEDIDAIAALQMRRSQPFPLMTQKGKTRAELNGRPLKVNTAHFGLTLIRLDALKQIPKPWFKGEPGADGSWRADDRLDPDIWFWHQWQKAGKTVYVAPDVRIGHLEVMVSEFDDEYQPRHVYVPDWRKANKK